MRRAIVLTVVREDARSKRGSEAVTISDIQDHLSRDNQSICSLERWQRTGDDLVLSWSQHRGLLSCKEVRSVPDQALPRSDTSRRRSYIPRES
jgi:hypothetical protein